MKYLDTHRKDLCSLEESMLNEFGGKNEIISLKFLVDTASCFIIKPDFLLRKPSKSRIPAPDFNIPAN